MTIALDNVEFDTDDKTIILDCKDTVDRKYVEAVDNKVDLLVTDDDKTAKFFRENGIAVIVDA